MPVRDERISSVTVPTRQGTVPSQTTRVTRQRQGPDKATGNLRTVEHKACESYTIRNTSLNIPARMS